VREKDPCDNYFPLVICYSHGVVPGAEPPPIDETDDLNVVVYSMQELMALQVGQVLEESIWLRPCTTDPNTEYSCDNWHGEDPEYQFTWRITRLPDAQVPVVDPVNSDHSH
jgi:hypothetical protein